MDYLKLMQSDQPYVVDAMQMPNDQKNQAQELCWQLNNLRPGQSEGRQRLIKDLFGTATDLTFVESNFHCDYGFNIHFHGMALINYNCTILDTSPVNIGNGAFLAPGVVLACSGHAMMAAQRQEAVMTSAPITLAENVWLGANVTVTAGITIGSGSVIGAGSVVTKDIPAGVLAAGSPAKVIRKISAADYVELTKSM